MSAAVREDLILSHAVVTADVEAICAREGVSLEVLLQAAEARFGQRLAWLERV